MSFRTRSGIYKKYKYFYQKNIYLNNKYFAAFLARPRNTAQRKTPRVKMTAKTVSARGQFLPLPRQAGLSPTASTVFAFSSFLQWGYKVDFKCPARGRGTMNFPLNPIAVRWKKIHLEFVEVYPAVGVGRFLKNEKRIFWTVSTGGLFSIHFLDKQKVNKKNKYRKLIPAFLPCRQAGAGDAEKISAWHTKKRVEPCHKAQLL